MTKIPVIDKRTGQQKVDRQNRKQWKCHTADRGTGNRAEQNGGRRKYNGNLIEI